MREQLTNAQAQTAAAQAQANAAQSQTRLTMLQPIVLFWADLLSQSRLKDREQAGDMPATHWRHIRLTLTGPAVDSLSELTDRYIDALRGYAKGHITLEEIEQLRERTVADISALIAVPL